MVFRRVLVVPENIWVEARLLDLAAALTVAWMATGHLDCKAGDWKKKCYRCEERRHIERNCKNSPKKLRREQSYSRSPVWSHSYAELLGHFALVSRSIPLPVISVDLESLLESEF